MTFPLASPHPFTYEAVLRAAFAEDLGLAGDLTTEAVVPPDATASGSICVRCAGVLAGIEVAAQAFRLYDSAVEVAIAHADGERVAPGTVAGVVSGPARSVLTAERTALNLLGRLSGMASLTRSVVDAVAGTGAAVVCTRKTTPGLRALEKYAVRAGGGSNHRFGLDDAVLIKDNHVAIAGSVVEAVNRVRQRVGHMVKVEVEVDTLEQLDDLLSVGADAVLLDNMAPPLLREAVALVGGRMLTEASGGIIPESARAVAESGVDMLSLGWLTHSPAALDVGLDLTAA